MINASLPVFVIHVRTATDRERLMQEQLDEREIPFEFIAEGDISDLTPEIIEAYFTGPQMSGAPKAVQSCAYKHLLAYRKLLQSGEPWGLILEDDVYLSSNFTHELQHILEEAKKLSFSEKALIKLEGSMLQWVPAHLLKDDQRIYPMDQGRAAGAYLVSAALAADILEDLKLNKCAEPIDWHHNTLAVRIGLRHYWTHPTLAEQGSHSGKISSLIDHKSAGTLRRFLWELKRLRRRYLRGLFR